MVRLEYDPDADAMFATILDRYAIERLDADTLRKAFGSRTVA